MYRAGQQQSYFSNNILQSEHFRWVCRSVRVDAAAMYNTAWPNTVRRVPGPPNNNTGQSVSDRGRSFMVGMSVVPLSP